MDVNITSSAHNLHHLRREYISNTLDESQLPRSPFALFSRWFKDIEKSDILDPSAASLSTVTAENMPSSRIILVKEFGPKGFVFYTNYDSNKGKDLAQNPNACLLFYWDTHHKQVRIHGTIQKVSPEQSNAYFKSRPKESQIAAIISSQSHVIPSRKPLTEAYLELEKSKEPLECPKNWGGYCLAPTLFEFWQGREYRLHDRIRYTQISKNHWTTERLAP